MDYHIGSSVASSFYGVARATLDVDLIVNFPPQQIEPFVQQLKTMYYVDAEMIREAVQRRSSFNLIHLETMIKIDIFVNKDQAFDREVFRRVQHVPLEDEPDPRNIALASPEDVLLRKLEWYKGGGEVSERQWNDVLGMLKVQGQL